MKHPPTHTHTILITLFLLLTTPLLLTASSPTRVSLARLPRNIDAARASKKEPKPKPLPTPTSCTRTAAVTQHSALPQLHVSSSGNVVDPDGCVIHLLGINEGGLFLGDASGTTDLSALRARMQFFHQTFHSNIVRVNYQAYWWTSDAYVPDARMHYRQWLQTYVTLEEQAGNYVELDTGPQWHDPPCGNDGMGMRIIACHPQAGSQRNRADPTQAVWYQPTALQSIHDLATIYRDDPAILFDVWNEPFESEIGQNAYLAGMNARINTVRAQAPRMPVVVFFRYLDAIMAAKAPNYTQGNLLIDHHIYGIPTPKLRAQVSFCRAHAMASIVNEYGGRQYPAAAAGPLEYEASHQDVGLLYFTAANLVNEQNNTPPPYPLTSNGILVRAQYQRLLSAFSQNQKLHNRSE